MVQILVAYHEVEAPVASTFNLNDGICGAVKNRLLWRSNEG